MLAALAARQSRCEMRWSFPTLGRPEIVDGGLSIAGQVRLEVRICGFGGHKVGTETADFTLTLRPVHTESDVLVFSPPRKIDEKPDPEGGMAELEQVQAVASKPGSATEAITPSI